MFGTALGVEFTLFNLFFFILFYSITVGLYYCFNNLSDARIFIIMYGVTSMYFSAVMVCFTPNHPLYRTLQIFQYSVHITHQHAATTLHVLLRYD